MVVCTYTVNIQNGPEAGFDTPLKLMGEGLVMILGVRPCPFQSMHSYLRFYPFSTLKSTPSHVVAANSWLSCQKRSQERRCRIRSLTNLWFGGFSNTLELQVSPLPVRSKRLGDQSTSYLAGG